MTEQPEALFGALLRQLRVEAGLSQEELAEAAGISARTISDAERGISHTARKTTVRRLADALRLTGSARAAFEATARGRAPAGTSTASTRTLPRDIASFTGRQYELVQLVGAAASGAVEILTISGMAGIGKTALAVHVANQLAPLFPDGQVFLPLHGHTPGRRPADPADALASLLLTVGVAPQQIPPGLEPRSGLWRDHLAGKQLLLLLDDAAGSEQVQPFLPGAAAGGSLVLVTSRRHLLALEDAQAISLDTLPPEDAAALLVRLARRPGLKPRDPVVAQITALCGYLPLAIVMLANQLHHHPAWTPAVLAADLMAARDRLELMAAENLSVAAAFDLSYRDLSEEEQRLFRRLGMHPGIDIDVYATAALGGIGLNAARRDLRGLYDQHLLTEPARGRYRLHDLIREHARALAATDPAADRDQALGRLLDYYQYTAASGEILLAPQRHTRVAAAALTPPLAIPDLPGRTRVLSWARTERANLLACLDYATRTGQQARVIALTAAIAGLLRHDGPWIDAITRHNTAVQAARDLGDQQGEADALIDLGVVHRLTGDYRDAAEVLEVALSLYRELGDRLGQANALTEIGIMRQLTGDYRNAAQAQEVALSLYRELGDRLGQASALNNLGTVRRQTGNYQDAAQAQEAALDIYRELGDPGGTAEVLNEVGTLHRIRSDLGQARDYHRQALDLAHEIASSWDEAHALAGLGRCALAAGHTAEARASLQQALEIFQLIGTAEAPSVAAELDALIEASRGHMGNSSSNAGTV